VFDRYTEKARRVIFFARYEASQFGSPFIETEHLLLGLLREDKALTNRFFPGDRSPGEIRKIIEENSVVRETVSTSVDLPLSNESKRILAYAAEEAELLTHKHIGTEHLLLGLLREEKSFAAGILHEYGVHLDDVRNELRGIEAPAPLRSMGRWPKVRIINPDRSLLCLVDWTGGMVIPREGERLTLDIDDDVCEYRVVNITHHYETRSGKDAKLDILEIMVAKLEPGSNSR
jgi:ATP-dependent Clp protease ATP-binding subunit ClpC